MFQMGQEGAMLAQGQHVRHYVLEDFPNSARWYENIAARPAAERALEVNGELRPPITNLDGKVRDTLFGNRGRAERYMTYWKVQPSGEGVTRTAGAQRFLTPETTGLDSGRRSDTFGRGVPALSRGRHGAGPGAVPDGSLQPLNRRRQRGDKATPGKPELRGYPRGGGGS